MDSSAYFTFIDNKVQYIKRICDLVQYLIKEKTADVMLETTKKNRTITAEKKWMDFLNDMEKCIDTANILKPYLAASNQTNFEKTGIIISQLNFLFFNRKNTLIKDELDDLTNKAEAVSKNLPRQERRPFLLWKTELKTITKEFELLISKMRKYENI